MIASRFGASSLERGNGFVLVSSESEERSRFTYLRAALREPPVRRHPFAWSFFRSALAETLNQTMIDRRDVPVTELTDAELFVVAAGGLPEPREDSKKVASSSRAVHTPAIDLFSKTALKNASCTNRITAD